jgi:hypothetical protein
MLQSRRTDCVRVSPLLPTPDEFPMNFEGVGGLSSKFLLFSKLSANWELTSQRPSLARQPGPKKLYRAGPVGLACRGAIKLAEYLIVSYVP